MARLEQTVDLARMAREKIIKDTGFNNRYPLPEVLSVASVQRGHRNPIR